MEKSLDKSSLVFMSDLLDSMIDEINITIYSTNDTELLKILEYEKLNISKAFCRLENFITMRGYRNE